MRVETRVILNNSFSEKDKKDFKKFSMIIQKQYMDKMYSEKWNGKKLQCRYFADGNSI